MPSMHTYQHRRAKKEAALGAEPEGQVDGVCRVAVRLANGTKVQRTFLATDRYVCMRVCLLKSEEMSSVLQEPGPHSSHLLIHLPSLCPPFRSPFPIYLSTQIRESL